MWDSEIQNLQLYSTFNFQVIFDSVKSLWQIEEFEFPILRYTLVFTCELISKICTHSKNQIPSRVYVDCVKFFENQTINKPTARFFIKSRDEDYRFKYNLIDFIYLVVDQLLGSITEYELIYCLTLIFRLAQTNLLLHEKVTSACIGIFNK